MSLLDIGAAIGVVLIGIISAILKSYRDGYLRSALQRRQDTTQKEQQAHQKINNRIEDIHESTQTTQERVEDIDDKVESIGEAMVVLHADDDDVDTRQLRDQVGIDEMPSDIRSDADRWSES